MPDAEWTQAPFTVTKQLEGEWAYHAVFPGGGEMGGSILAESADDAKAKLAEIYPGITFVEETK